ncbi:two-component sensor histidine kinase BarA [Salmonella enterica subsp. enterica serovar Agona]|nr:two-component sensor histidine kinase BarA [Salmonella enterica subsp. enterica serovar Agona]
MTNYSLRARMMILILAPTVLIGLLLSIFFVVHRYNDLQRQLEDAGASIIEPLAVSSEYGMNLQNRESIGQLISVLHRRHSDIVRAISVYDDHNRLFVTSNFHLDPSQMQLPAGAPFPRRLSVDRHGDIMILRTPIISESYSPDESAIADAKNTKNMLGYVALELDLKSVRLQQYKEIFISSVMMLFCIGIALIFGWRLMRDVTGPIRNMVNTVDRIRRGQLDSRVEGFMLGELDMLKNGINSMAMSLAAYHEEMQHNIDQATSDLRETLEQMEIQNVELDLAKKRAQEAARIKSEFLANMSHELRTPLNGVIGFTRLTLKTELNPTQRDHLNTIERSANNLLAIINDVLDFSKLEAGKLILESIPFPLRNTLDEVVTLLAHSSHDKGLELTLNIKNDVPDNVIGDPLRLQQVITNLVGNAIKFTESGNIDILVEKRALSNTKVQIEVQIRDTGIGIPERDQSRLFQAFRQADASISRRHGGTGLGLAITNTVESFLTHQLAINPPPRAILSLILIVGMMTIVRFGEQMIVKAMSILVFPFVAALMLLALYLIPQWNGAALETLSFDSAASTGNGLWMTLWLAIPVMVFSFNHSPIISSFAVAKREEYGEGAEKKCSKILAFAHIMMVLTVMFFVFSCVLSLTPADLAAAKEQNISILSYLANHFNAPIIAWMAPIIAMIAITKSFLGHYLGAREGFNGMVIKSLRGKGKSIEINKLNKITALFMLVTTWIVATLNPSILGMIETLGGPIIAMILFLMPMYAIQKVPAMRKYSGHISNVFVVIMGLIAISAIFYSLFS